MDATGADRDCRLVSELRGRVRRCEDRDVEEWQKTRLTDAESHALFDRLFPHGFAGADVLEEIAPEGWERSRLLECFHPSVERVFEERVAMHHNLEELGRTRSPRDGAAGDVSFPEPTLDDVRREYEPHPVHQDEELTDLVGLCLWDIFSDNHDVIAADGRVVDIGSFRGAGGFLDEHVHGDRDRLGEGDYLRFYLGTIWIAGRADLSPLYTMIFRRLRTLSADWAYHFPELGLVEFAPLDDGVEQPPTSYSVSDGAVAELNAQQRRADVQRVRADMAEMNARAREEAMDRPPPATVRAYRQVYGRDPRGWPPA